MRRPWYPLAIAIAIAAGAPGCGDGGAPARGFHSRQLLSSRDPTLTLVGFSTKLVNAQGPNGPISYYDTDPDSAYYTVGDPGAQIYWQVSLLDNTVTEVGPKIPPLPPSSNSPDRYECRFESMGSGPYTMVIVDPVTGLDVASIDRVVSLSGCARYPDGFLAIVRLDDAGFGRLWTGPFDQLTQANLDLAIDAEIVDNWSNQPDPTMWSMRVLAAIGSSAAGRGIYDVSLSTLTTTEVIAPALPALSWAAGSTPSGATGSNGLASADVVAIYLPGPVSYYFYQRHMDDGSDVMFAGPLPPPAPRELALFAIAGATLPVSYEVANGPLIDDITTWQQTAAPGSSTEWLQTWDAVGQRLISCPFASGTLPGASGLAYSLVTGSASPHGSRYAFADIDVFGHASGSAHSPLIGMFLAGAGSCDLLAATDVKLAAVDDDAVAWIQSPRGGGDETLWVAGAPGDAPRAIGSMAILDAPIFIAADTLQVQLNTDLAWLDVRDDPVKMHYVAERVFGTPATGTRWLVTGYDFSDQDGAGTLGVVDWPSGQKRPISPAVSDFRMSSDQSARRPLNILYLVHGRSPSSQDGIWAATIDTGDLP